MYAHLVADETASSRYLRALRLWADFIEKWGLDCISFDDLDRSLAQFQAHACFVDDKHPALGDQLMNGVTYLFPESENCFRRGWRCLKVWHRIHIEGKGGPAAEEVLRVMEDELRVAGFGTEADMMALAVDCYLREQDMVNLRFDDVSFAKGAAVLRLGRSSRGESSKTGRDQGVMIDSDEIRDMLMKRKEEAEAHHGADYRTRKVFGISADQYRKQWWWAVARVGLPVGPPHTARHTGASKDAFLGYRTQDQIQKRGRWTSERSVIRYSRTHDYANTYENVPSDILKKGERLLATRKRPAKARD